MQTCSQCGSQNTDDSRFCSHCGHALEPVTPVEVGPADSTATITFGAPKDPDDRSALNEADAAAADALPPGSALLIVQRGPGAGSRYLLDTESVTAGRHPESDIFLDDITVSRRHVDFHREGNTFRVHDVGSLNGTYVNRDRIDDALLQNGDEVRIGKFRLVFFASAAAEN